MRHEEASLCKVLPETASIADRNREGVRTSFADLDPLAHKVAEILGRELQERLFDLRPSNSRCVELRMSRQGDVMSSKSSMLSPEQKKICDTAYLQALRLAESQGLGTLSKKPEVRMSPGKALASHKSDSYLLAGHSHCESPAGFDGTLQASESSAL